MGQLLKAVAVVGMGLSLTSFSIEPRFSATALSALDPARIAQGRAWRGVGAGFGVAARSSGRRTNQQGVADPALCRPYEVVFSSHNHPRAGAPLFQPGAAPDLWLQSLGRRPIVPRGSAPRSRLRDLLVGRSRCAGTEYPRPPHWRKGWRQRRPLQDK